MRWYYNNDSWPASNIIRVVRLYETVLIFPWTVVENVKRLAAVFVRIQKQTITNRERNMYSLYIIHVSRPRLKSNKPHGQTEINNALITCIIYYKYHFFFLLYNFRLKLYISRHILIRQTLWSYIVFLCAHTIVNEMSRAEKYVLKK